MNKFIERVAVLSVSRIALLGLLVTAGYYLSLYDSGASIQTQIDSSKQQLEEERTKKADTEKTLKKEQEMRADIVVLGKEFEEVKSKIPADFREPELRIIVNQLVEANNIKITRQKNTDKKVDFGPGQEMALVEQVVLEYTFYGSYNQILNFISQLAQVEKTVRLGDFSISTQQGSDGPGKQLLFDTLIVGYKQGSGKGATKPGDKP